MIGDDLDYKDGSVEDVQFSKYSRKYTVITETGII